jgi:hypothetical protein
MMGWACGYDEGHKDAHIILTEKPLVKRPLGRLRRWANGIKMDLMEMMN